MVMIAAQCIGFLAVGLYLLSYQLKKRAHIVWVTFVSNLFYVLQYCLLGAFSGAVMDVLSTLASFLAARKHASSMKKYAKIVALGSVFVMIGVGIVLAFLQGDWIELIPIAGAVFQTVGLWCDDEQALRKFGLCSAPFWLVYNFISQAYGAAFGSLCAIISIVVSLCRYRRGQDVQ